MGKILCATRGGEASIHAQDAAIRLAKESGDELIFFFVADVEFLAQANYALRTDIVVQEINKMADFLLDMAIERAGQAGIEARCILRHGEFVEQLEAAIREEAITTVVLGHPADADSAFKIEALQKLAARIQADTGVEVWIAPPGHAAGKEE